LPFHSSHSVEFVARAGYTGWRWLGCFSQQAAEKICRFAITSMVHVWHNPDLSGLSCLSCLSRLVV
jgi:hypothetical protein